MNYKTNAHTSLSTVLWLLLPLLLLFWQLLLLSRLLHDLRSIYMQYNVISYLCLHDDG